MYTNTSWTSEVINANNNTNPDLFKALKGGSCNFGIVSRFDMQAIDGYTLWGGQITWFVYFLSIYTQDEKKASRSSLSSFLGLPS